MPVTQALSIPPTSDTSQCALNSIRQKWSSGYRSGTPPAMSSMMICCGLIVFITACVFVRFAASWASMGRFSSSAMARTCFNAIDSASPTFTPPVAQWKNTCAPIARVAAHNGASSGDQYGRGADVGERDRRSGDDAVEVRRVAFDDVVVVDAGVGDRQFVVVAVEREQRTVRVHQLRVDAVEIHVLEHSLRVARVRRTVVVAVARHRPALETGRADTRELTYAAWD